MLGIGWKDRCMERARRKVQKVITKEISSWANEMVLVNLFSLMEVPTKVNSNKVNKMDMVN